MKKTDFRVWQFGCAKSWVGLFGSVALVSIAVSGCGGGGSSSSTSAATSSAFTVGGSVTGLATGAQLGLLDNSASPITLTANGAFQFTTAISAGGSYSVTVQTQPTGQTCTVSGGSGTNVTANVSGIAVSCSNTTTSAYTWKGPITEYVGTIQSPSIASLGSGSLAGAFVATQVQVMLGSFTSNTWGAPTTLSTPSGTPTGYVVVLPSGTAGNAVVAWTSQVSGSTTYSVWASLYSASTQAWGAPAQIGTATSPQVQGGASQSGYAAFGWLQASTAVAGATALGIWELDPSGASAPTTELETGSVSSATLAMGVDAAGVISVAWAGATQVQLAISGTSLWSAPASLGLGSSVVSSGDISLAVDATQGDAVAWSGSDGTIHAAFYSPNGTVQASNTISVAGAVNSLPSIASAGGGSFVMVFAETTSTATANYGYSAKYSASTGWGSTISIGQIGWGDSHLMIDGSGDAVVVNHILVGNEAAYSMPAGSTAWSGGNVEYAVPASASAMEVATGRVATLWSNTASPGQPGISSDFFD